MAPPEDPNYLVHAFKSQYNLIALGTALGFAVLSGTALPLLVAAGVDLVVLPLVAGSERYQRLVRAQQAAERSEADRHRRQAETAEMLGSLTADERGRYRELERLAGEIRENYAGLGETSRMLLDDLVGKLDFLLAFYLRMRHSLMRYETYFATTDPEQIRERMAMIDHEITQGPDRIRPVKKRTRSVLHKRLDRYDKALESRQLIEAQTETVQEVLRLLRDQSYQMRDPRPIAAQLEGLVSSAEETERGVREMEVLLGGADAELAPGGFDAELAELDDDTPAAARPTSTTSTPASPVKPTTPVRNSPPPPRKITH